MSAGTLFWILTVVLCGAFLIVSWKFKGEAGKSFKNYTIGGATFGFILIFFTQFASIMGTGNFIGQGGSGYTTGLPWLVFILGEQGSKIIFALFIAGFAGKFTYVTFAELMDDLIVRDKITRALAGGLGACIMIAWFAGQAKGFGAIFQVFTNADPLPIILLFTAIFIVYTWLGGIYSVVWTDLIQGIICVVFGTLFYIIAFKEINFSMATLGERLAAVGKAELFTFKGVGIASLVTKFLTGCVGIIVAQMYWQRCFASKTPKIARDGLLWSGIIAVLMTMGTAMVGLIVMTLKQDLASGDVIPWFMLNRLPLFVSAMIFVLILAAGMSSADSNLNSAAVLVTNDFIRPFKKNVTDEELVKWAKLLTLILGVVGAFCSIYAATIMSMFSKAYTLAGGGLVPVLLVGLFWKERKEEKFRMGTKNSKVTAWGARCGIVTGAVLSMWNALLGPNAILYALPISAVVTIIVSNLTRNVKNPFESEGAVPDLKPGVEA